MSGIWLTTWMRFGNAARSPIWPARNSRSSVSLTVGAASQLDVRDRQLACVHVGAPDGGRHLDARVPVQRLLDRGRIDVVAASDDQLLAAGP